MYKSVAQCTRWSLLRKHALVALMAGLGVATFASTAYAMAPKDTLVIGKPADPQTLDPAITIDNNDWTVTYPVYQKLMRYKQADGKGYTEVEGDLAQSWQASSDNLDRKSTRLNSSHQCEARMTPSA